VSSVVLDASALLALLNREPGAGVVATALADGASICAVNLSEVVAKLAEIGAPEEAIRQALDSLGLEILDFGADLAYQAGMMRPATRQIGLSLGDRCCLALGKHLGLPVLTADRAWLDLAVGVEVRAIR
jgi:ribonuclease VapC